MECRRPSSPVLQISRQDVTAVYQLLGVGFLLHQLVCLPRDEMKLSPRREPNIIASGLVSVAARPVAAFASSNNRLRIHNRGGRRLWSGHLQLCHLAKMVSKPCPKPPACGLQWPHHLAYTNGYTQEESRFSPPWLTNSLWLCWIKVTSFPQMDKGMATYSSILAWRIPQTEEPGGSTGHKELDMIEWLSTHTSLLKHPEDISKIVSDLRPQIYISLWNANAYKLAKITAFFMLSWSKK